MTREFQKKRLAKALLLIYVVLFILGATSCSSAREKKLNKILPDVDYDFVIFNRDNIIINGNHYDINELAYDVSGKKNQRYITFSVLIDNYLYYSYEYKNRKKLFASSDENPYTADIALFRTNLKTAETKLLYDFKKVVPRGRFNYSNYDCCRYADEKTLVFIYNGDLMTFDLGTESITQTLHFYDKELFRNIDYKDVHGNKYGDYYYMLGDGVLRYAEYRDGELIDHSFTVDEKSGYVNRFGDYVYTSRYIKDLTYDYYNCINLKTGEETDRDCFMDIVRQHKEQEQREREQAEQDSQNKADKQCFTVGDKTYYYEDDYLNDYRGNSITIKNEDGETLYKINDKYAFDNNPKYAELFGVYRNCDGIGAGAGATVFENRLFISFMCQFGWLGNTANMIFEFNPETGNLSYVTYIYNRYYFFDITTKTDSGENAAK